MPLPQLVLFTTERHCHLCEDARVHLDRIRARRPFDLRVVVIDAHPMLSIRHALRIPVVLVDGVEVAFGRIDPQALEAALLSHGTVLPGP
jgi:hypothetical protein